MADTDVWGLGGPIASPAATDRVPFATGPGAGGYSERGAFVYRDAAGVFQASGILNVEHGGVGEKSLTLSNTSWDRSLQFIATAGGYRINSQDWTSSSAKALAFATGGVDRVIIDAAGNFGLGTISPAARLHVKSSGEIARLETTTARGSGNGFVTFFDPTGRKAYFGYGGAGDDITFMNELPGAIKIGTNALFRIEIDGSGLRPATDNALPCGGPSNRWSVLYSGTGTINTCDVRLKFYRADPAPTLDEHAAALECFEVFGFFQHLDAIAREEDGGSPARWHFGPKAQEVWTIFAAHGLAAPLGEDGLPPEGSVPPAFLCFDAWGAEVAPVMAWWRPSEILGPDGEAIMVPCEEGEEGTEQRPTGETYVTREAGNIFGVRIDQLQSLMLVAIRKEMLALTDRVAALEAV